MGAQLYPRNSGKRWHYSTRFCSNKTKKCCFLFVCHTFSLGVLQDAAISSLCCRGLKDVTASVWQSENGKKGCGLQFASPSQWAANWSNTFLSSHPLILLLPSYLSLSLSLSPRLLYNISLFFFLSFPSLVLLHQVWVNTKRSHRRRCRRPET